MTTVYGINLAEIETDDEGYYFDNFRFTEELFETEEDALREAKEQAKEALIKIIKYGPSLELSYELAEEVNDSTDGLKAKVKNYNLVVTLNDSPIDVSFLAKHTNIFDYYTTRLFTIIKLELPAGI